MRPSNNSNMNSGYSRKPNVSGVTPGGYTSGGNNLADDEYELFVDDMNPATAPAVASHRRNNTGYMPKSPRAPASTNQNVDFFPHDKKRILSNNNNNFQPQHSSSRGNFAKTGGSNHLVISTIDMDISSNFKRLYQKNAGHSNNQHNNYSKTTPHSYNNNNNNSNYRNKEEYDDYDNFNMNESNNSSDMNSIDSSSYNDCNSATSSISSSGIFDALDYVLSSRKYYECFHDNIENVHNNKYVRVDVTHVLIDRANASYFCLNCEDCIGACLHCLALSELYQAKSSNGHIFKFVKHLASQLNCSFGDCAKKSGENNLIPTDNLGSMGLLDEDYSSDSESSSENFLIDPFDFCDGKFCSLNENVFLSFEKLSTLDWLEPENYWHEINISNVDDKENSFLFNADDDLDNYDAVLLFSKHVIDKIDAHNEQVIQNKETKDIIKEQKEQSTIQQKETEIFASAHAKPKSMELSTNEKDRTVAIVNNPFSSIKSANTNSTTNNNTTNNTNTNKNKSDDSFGYGANNLDILANNNTNTNTTNTTNLPKQSRSQLLESFRTNPSAFTNLNIIDIKEHVLEFSKDQYGSRFIQQKLENSERIEEKELVFLEICETDEILLNLITDVFGNYVVQKMLEFGSVEQKSHLISKLHNCVIHMSMQMYGCRVIQKAIEFTEGDLRMEIVKELHGNAMSCVTDQNANHVIQKCIEYVENRELQFIIDEFYGKVYFLSTHPYGCRVIQRLMEYCQPEQTLEIMREIFTNLDELVNDQYGNYVIQHVLDHKKHIEYINKIIKYVFKNIYNLSSHKFSSNVVEKCVIYSNHEQRVNLIHDLVGEPYGRIVSTNVNVNVNINNNNSVNVGGANMSNNNNNSPSSRISVNSHDFNDLVVEGDRLFDMMKDQFGNYVMQRLYDSLTYELRSLLVKRMKNLLPYLRKVQYGKHLYNKLEKYLREEMNNGNPISAMQPSGTPPSQSAASASSNNNLNNNNPNNNLMKAQITGNFKEVNNNKVAGKKNSPASNKMYNTNNTVVNDDVSVNIVNNAGGVVGYNRYNNIVRTCTVDSGMVTRSNSKELYGTTSGYESSRVVGPHNDSNNSNNNNNNSSVPQPFNNYVTSSSNTNKVRSAGGYNSSSALEHQGQLKGGGYDNANGYEKEANYYNTGAAPVLREKYSSSNSRTSASYGSGKRPTASNYANRNSLNVKMGGNGGNGQTYFNGKSNGYEKGFMGNEEFPEFSATN